MGAVAHFQRYFALQSGTGLLAWLAGEFSRTSWVCERIIVDIEKLGRYDIIRVLGKGAMGVVYEGRDPNLDRRVAIKTIRVQSMSPEAAVEYDGRFRTEARSAARLHHPNIVSVFDSGQDEDVAYLVMEFIEGRDLKHHLESGARFPVRSAIVMVHELLMALDHAHRQNVVHRDIKPANMLIETTGRVKLTDFGVARIQEPDETHLTQVGGAVGTPKYMSPEQAKGLRGDSRSDVFSAGVVLYELLTGALPFDGDNQFVVIHQIVTHEPTPPSQLDPEVPVAMDAVLASAMAKNPEERFATAREFALALRAVAQEVTAATGPGGVDVAAELGEFLAGRAAAAPASLPLPLRDGSSTGIFGPSGEVSLITTVNHEAELALWNDVRDSTDAADLQAYLDRFPAGIYARRAQHRLDQLALSNTFTQAKTEPQFRPEADTSDLDSTVGPYVPTVPMEAPHQPADPVAAPVGTTHPAAPVPAAPAAPRKSWAPFAIGGVLCGMLVLGVLLRPKAPVEPDPRPAVAAPAIVVAPEPPPSAPVAAAIPASVPAVAHAAVASSPAVHVASHAAKVASAPLASVSRPVKPKAPAIVPSEVPQPAPREVAPVVVSQGSAPGPSMAGQICADRVFIFRIACVAEQCAKDRYRQTAECVRFKEMERKREEDRASRR